MLKTKSIQDKKSKSDGIRICIMRRIKPEFIFDMWIPNLAPSSKLLDEYHEDKIDWKIFTRKYEKEVFNKQSTFINLIGDLAANKTVTILCWEKKGENCHRLLVASRLRTINPILVIIHI